MNFKEKLQIIFQNNNIQINSEQLEKFEIYYKKNKVAYRIYVSSNGSLSNAEGSEFYWVKRATKSILPAFKNKMINIKLEHIL